MKLLLMSQHGTYCTQWNVDAFDTKVISRNVNSDSQMNTWSTYLHITALTSKIPINFVNYQAFVETLLVGYMAS